VELFSKREDVSAEIAMWGKVIGQEKIKTVWPKHEAQKGPDGKPMTMPPGSMVEHQFTTPLIEVAGDGQTAKGIWFSPGHETGASKEGKPIAHWCWGRYGADFIKEDGKWKIWHWHWYDTFMCPYDQSWVDYPQPAPDVVLHPPGLDPDSPPTIRSSYYPDRNRIELPYPVPYETWDDKSVA
jgi:hypothetical protein